MNTSQVSIDELRTNLADYIGRVMYGKDRVIIKKYNREAAVLISKEEYERLLDPTKRLSVKEWDENVKRMDNIRKNIPDVEPEIIEKEIKEAVKQVRAEKRKKA